MMAESESSIAKSEELPPAPLGQKLVLFGLTAVVLVLDQATKHWVETRMVFGESWSPLPQMANLFQFTHVINRGMAFGAFQQGSMLFTLMAVLVAGAIVYYNFTLPAGQWPLRIALGLQLGGALGNLVDRLRQGHVTDFLDFGPWPVFNVADTAIVVGVVILAWLAWQEHRQTLEVTGSASANSVASQPSSTVSDDY